MIKILLEEMCTILLYKDEKGLPFMNFKVVNAKNLEMQMPKI